ncbi:hypothetical protein SSX86_018258 [Deinandra increscens subsp. villosa]|uniref:Transferase, Chloramphenicol acetyltransferase-like domain protein n=1 Tax=Deinandra increscens subsp. villosa TaxID=3103831 RepID=A0AAP0CXF0_9ASTR
MGFSIKIEKQSTKFVKPIVQTPSTLFHYKLGFIDELVPAAYDVAVVLFFSTNTNHNTNLFVQLERSLGKTLTRFNPLAGRYVDNNPSIDCNDYGAEFIRAKVNIKLQDFLVSEGNAKLIDEFIPSKIGSTALQQSDPLLAAQVTTFECGSVAIGVSATHKIVDASTLSTLINEWAVTNREENEIESTGPHFNSSLLFPGRGLSSLPMQPMDNDILSNYTRKKLSFSGSLISDMKAKRDKSTGQWSKVQIVSAIIWKTFIDADFAIHNFHRESTLIQPINLRGKMASLIPKSSCGNLWGLYFTECESTLDTTEKLADRLSDSVKKTVTVFSLGHHNQEEGQAMVLNSFLNMKNIGESTNGVSLTSWCRFPFYEVDFGFGKPIWAAPGTIPINNSVYLMDDAEGNGVEAYVFLELKYVPYFEEALQHVNAFAT